MTSNKFIIKIDPAELVPKTGARIYYYAAFLIIILQGTVLAWIWKYIPKVVPLFFTEPWGEGRLAPKVYLAILPTLALLSIIVNLILGRKAKDESPLLSYTLAVASLVITIMFVIAMAGILQSIL